MTGRIAADVERLVAAGGSVVIVTVSEARGSTPRPSGTRMAVTETAIYGTIGGGRLEWDAIGRAREMIAAGVVSDTLDMPLGPAVGQCCGGRVTLSLDRADAAAVAEIAEAEARARHEAPQIVVFGAGHVGKALVGACATLPVRILWSDARPGVSPPQDWDNVDFDVSDPVEITGRAEAGAAVVIMTYSHALDYTITEAALGRDDLAYVGLIGSRTKRSRFERWFLARGGEAGALDRLVCPIGDMGVQDKRPEVIAALVTAEVVQALARHAKGASAEEQQGKEAVE